MPDNEKTQERRTLIQAEILPLSSEQDAEAIVNEADLSRKRPNVDLDPKRLLEIGQLTASGARVDADTIFNEPSFQSHNTKPSLIPESDRISNLPRSRDLLTLPEQISAVEVVAIASANKVFSSAIDSVMVSIIQNDQILSNDRQRLITFIDKVSNAILTIPSQLLDSSDPEIRDRKYKEKRGLVRDRMIQFDFSNSDDTRILKAVAQYSELLKQTIAYFQGEALENVIKDAAGESYPLSPNVQLLASESFKILEDMIILSKNKLKEGKPDVLPESLNAKKENLEETFANHAFLEALTESLTMLVMEEGSFDSQELPNISNTFRALGENITQVQMENSNDSSQNTPHSSQDKLEEIFSDNDNVALLIRAMPQLRTNLENKYYDIINKESNVEPLTENQQNLIFKKFKLFFMILENLEQSYTQITPTEIDTQSRPELTVKEGQRGIIGTFQKIGARYHGMVDGIFGRNVFRNTITDFRNFFKKE